MREIDQVVYHEDWINFLPSTWYLNKKLYSDGSVNKLTACLCAQFDSQIEGINFFGTFVPVINWTTAGLMVIILTILGLSTNEAYYITSFFHAHIYHNFEWYSLSQKN